MSYYAECFIFRYDGQIISYNQFSENVPSNWMKKIKNDKYTYGYYSATLKG